MDAATGTVAANDIIGMSVNYFQQFGWHIVGALITFVIGWWLIGLIKKILVKIMDKSKIEPSLTGFLRTLFDFFMKMILIITCLSMIGVDMTSFFAILGGLSVAVGFALKDSLGNIAAGAFILFFKPFKVGDYIEAAGFSGTVHEIQIMNTILKTPDNKHILFPNGKISTSVITNYSNEENRRLSLVYGVGYESNVEKVKSVLNEIISNDLRVLTDPAPQILLTELADSSVNFTVRIWCKASDYWPLQFDMNETVFTRFSENGINIPFPQMDVHMKSQA